MHQKCALQHLVCLQRANQRCASLCSKAKFWPIQAILVGMQQSTQVEGTRSDCFPKVVRCFLLCVARNEQHVARDGTKMGSTQTQKERAFSALVGHRTPERPFLCVCVDCSHLFRSAHRGVPPAERVGSIPADHSAPAFLTDHEAKKRCRQAPFDGGTRQPIVCWGSITL